MGNFQFTWSLNLSKTMYWLGVASRTIFIFSSHGLLGKRKHTRYTKHKKYSGTAYMNIIFQVSVSLNSSKTVQSILAFRKTLTCSYHNGTFIIKYILIMFSCQKCPHVLPISPCSFIHPDNLKHDKALNNKNQPECIICNVTKTIWTYWTGPTNLSKSWDMIEAGTLTIHIISLLGTASVRDVCWLATQDTYVAQIKQGVPHRHCQVEKKQLTVSSIFGSKQSCQWMAQSPFWYVQSSTCV